MLIVAADILSRTPDHSKARVFTKYVLKNLPHLGDIARDLASNGYDLQIIS